MNERHVAYVVLAALVLWLPALAGATHATGDVDIDVYGADGHRFATFPARSAARDVHRAWLEARNGERYRIHVRNRSARRVGLVIAVDGRNIISGARSELAHHERMYVLEPWESARYEGWRTGSDRVNEFYFTAWSDSYAEAFGDRSARGVIAVAVYRERADDWRRGPAIRRQSETGPAPLAEPGSSAQDRDAAREAHGTPSSQAESRAGTGFGEELHSPVRVVRFEAQRSPSARHFIRYEWRDTLCRKGVIACDGEEPNRFWDDDEGYAPYPPRRS